MSENVIKIADVRQKFWRPLTPAPSQKAEVRGLCRSCLCEITVVDSISHIWYTGAMSFARFLVGALLVSVPLLTCGQSVADNLDQQIAERTQQYQESLRQRTAQLSPSFQAKIELQTRKTVAKGLEKWKNGEISIRIALPRLAESQRIAQFVARHLPFSGSPAGSFVFGSRTLAIALTVTTGQHVAKPLAIPVFDLAPNRSCVVSEQHSGNILSFFIQIVHTIVQRQ